MTEYRRNRMRTKCFLRHRFFWRCVLCAGCVLTSTWTRQLSTCRKPKGNKECLCSPSLQQHTNTQHTTLTLTQTHKHIHIHTCTPQTHKHTNTYTHSLSLYLSRSLALHSPLTRVAIVVCRVLVYGWWIDNVELEKVCSAQCE